MHVYKAGLEASAGVEGRGVALPVTGVLAPDGPNELTGGTSCWFSPAATAVIYALMSAKDIAITPNPTHLKKCRQLALLGVKCPPVWYSTREFSHLSMRD